MVDCVNFIRISSSVRVAYQWYGVVDEVEFARNFVERHLPNEYILEHLAVQKGCFEIDGVHV